MAYSRYRSRRRVPRRRYTRRYPRKIRRTRRLARSTRSRATFKSQGLPKELYVRFPYYWQPSNSYVIAASETLRSIILGNSVCPTPFQLQPSTSSLGLDPTVDTGDQVVPGLIQYSGLYTSSCILGSSLRLELVFNALSSSPTITVVLLPVPYFDYNDFQGQLTALQSMTINSLCSQPYAKSRILNIPSSGHEKTVFKSYRSVKSMLKIRDVKGLLNNTTSTTTGYTNTNSGSWQDISFYAIGGDSTANPHTPLGFFWYYAAVSNSTTTGAAAQLFVSAKMVIYSCLADRVPLPLVTPSYGTKLSEASQHNPQISGSEADRGYNLRHSYRRFSRRY